jgi:type II secretory pathway pseudopilin PulG
MSSRKNKKNTAGFTLIELLIYLSLVSGILITASTFAWNIINSRTKAFAVQEVEQNGRFIMEQLTQTVRQAQKIAIPETNADTDRLSVGMRTAQDNPTDIYLEKSRLFMTRGNGAPMVLHSDQVLVTVFKVSHLIMPGDKSHTVKITLELQHRNPGNRQEWQARETFTTSLTVRDHY